MPGDAPAPVNVDHGPAISGPIPRSGTLAAGMHGGVPAQPRGGWGAGYDFSVQFALLLPGGVVIDQFSVETRPNILHTPTISTGFCRQDRNPHCGRRVVAAQVIHKKRSAVPKWQRVRWGGGCDRLCFRPDTRPATNF